jgi:hypothetical protein
MKAHMAGDFRERVHRADMRVPYRASRCALLSPPAPGSRLANAGRCASLRKDQTEDTVRWTVTVSRETDTALHSYLAQRGMKKDDISKFVEEAVRWRVLDRAVSEVKTRNAGISARKIQAAIDDALAAVRAERLVPASR